MPAKLNDNWALLSMGYDTVVLPVKDAVIIMECLSRAHKYDYTYVDNVKQHYVGGAPPAARIDIITAAEVAEGIATGAKPN